MITGATPVSGNGALVAAPLPKYLPLHLAAMDITASCFGWFDIFWYEMLVQIKEFGDDFTL